MLPNGLRILALAASLSFFAGCAAMQPLSTPTGKPEVTIQTTNASQIKGAIVSVMASNGYTLVQDTTYSLAFTRQMEGGSALLYQAALGNAYSSTPQMNVSYTFAPAGNSTRVFAHINTSMQNAFGQNQQMNMDRGKAAHQLQDMLLLVKSRVESGRKKG